MNKFKKIVVFKLKNIVNYSKITLGNKLKSFQKGCDTHERGE